MPLLRAAALTTALLTMTATAAADAATTRYVSPTGTGTACTSAAPCWIANGISGAATSDEIIVASGDYGSTAAPIAAQISFPAAGINLHGVPGQPRPRVFFNAAFGLSATPFGTRIADLEVSNADTTSGSSILVNGTVERVIARKSGQGEAIRVHNGVPTTISDTIAIGGTRAIYVSGPAAFDSVHATLQNVTAVSTSPTSYGLGVVSDTNRAADAVVRGSILRGTAGPARLDQTAAPASLEIADSFADLSAVVNSGAPSLIDGGHNSSAVPLFADFAGGDYHQAPGSPTIDYGATSSGSGLDVDGDARLLGAARDAGGDEFRPAPAPTTGDASAVTVSTATVSGTADTGGLGGTWTIEYGPTAAYVTSTPPGSLAAARGAQTVATALEGLPSNTDVHYRLVVTTSGGTVVGGDRVLHTATPAAAPTPTPTVTPTTTAAELPRITKLKVSKGRVRFTLSAAARVKITIRRGTRTVRTITRTLKAGNASVKLPKLRKGSYRISAEPSRVGTTVKGSFKVT